MKELKIVSDEKIKELEKYFIVGGYKFYNMMCSNYEIPEWFLRKYHKELNWNIVCRYQNLSESFIWDHINFISSCGDIEELCNNQKISIEILRKHKGDIDWGNFALYNTLTLEIVTEFYSEFNINYVKQRNLIEEFMTEDELEALEIFHQITK